MADTVTVVGVQFQAKGGSNVEKAFKRLGRETGLLKRNFSALSRKELMNVKRQLLSVNKATGNSINSMQAQKVALQGLRNMADVTGREFKELTRDIALLDQKMKQASGGGGAGGLKGRLKGLAKGAGAIAAGGIFGGPEGAVGGAIGLSMGGPAGAAVGAAVGAQVGMVRQQLASITEFSAQLALQRKALKLVIGDTQQFNKSQEFLLKTSRKLAIPQSVITRQFTSLTASVVGAGKSVEDAEEVFRAIAAGIRGTGGSLEDMKSAMRATAQVFSKGKVSAEELRQQLGERLPGAFTLFADSMNKTPAELDKALEQGKVTLDDFMVFAKELFATYGENAEILAAGPEAAGDRLKTSLEELNDDLGAILRPIGMQFQTLADGIVKQFGRIIKEIRKMVDGIAKERKLIDMLSLTKNERQKINTKAKNQAVKEIGATVFTQEAATKLSNLLDGNPLPDFLGVREAKKKFYQDSVGKTFEELNSFTFDMFLNYEKVFDKNLSDVTTELRRKMIEEMSELTGDTSFAAFRLGGGDGAADGAGDGGGGGDGDGDDELGGIQQGAQKYFSTIKSFAEETGEVVAKAFQGMEDALVKFVMTGKLNFSDLTRSILADMARIAIRQAIMKPFTGFIEGLFSANGNAFAANGVVPYRKGGVVNSPTYFRYGGSNLGIMGEAGPEAVMPLKRGRGGKLGVIAQGGGGGNITVNVDASGSAVEGDDNGGRQLGEVIAAAIQSELLQQKRPGGILA